MGNLIKEWTFQNGMDVWTVPGYMRDGVESYLYQGCPAGDFLTAVLENDLMRALQYADLENLRNLPAYGYVLYNYFPMGSYGSKGCVESWIAAGGLVGHANAKEGDTEQRSP